MSIPPVKPHLCQSRGVVGQYIDKYIIQGGLTLLNFKTCVSHGQCDLVLLDHLMTLVGRGSWPQLGEGGGGVEWHIFNSLDRISITSVIPSSRAYKQFDSAFCSYLASY